MIISTKSQVFFRITELQNYRITELQNSRFNEPEEFYSCANSARNLLKLSGVIPK